jgi:hypothetical protein
VPPPSLGLPGSSKAGAGAGQHQAWAGLCVQLLRSGGGGKFGVGAKGWGEHTQMSARRSSRRLVRPAARLFDKSTYEGDELTLVEDEERSSPASWPRQRPRSKKRLISDEDDEEHAKMHARQVVAEEEASTEADSEASLNETSQPVKSRSIPPSQPVPATPPPSAPQAAKSVLTPEQRDRMEQKRQEALARRAAHAVPPSLVAGATQEARAPLTHESNPRPQPQQQWATTPPQPQQQWATMPPQPQQQWATMPPQPQQQWATMPPQPATMPPQPQQQWATMPPQQQWTTVPPPQQQPAAQQQVAMPPPQQQAAQKLGQECFKCGSVSHWYRDCPMRTNAPPSQAQSSQASSSIEAKTCPKCQKQCAIRTSQTQRNPGRHFYKCDHPCNYFEWCASA